MLIAYPVAYWIAFRGGAHKSSLLFLLLLPFFVSFVIRTQSWNFILSDNGMILVAAEGLGLVRADFHILRRRSRCIGGLTYNFLPFMVLADLRRARAGRPGAAGGLRRPLRLEGSAFRKVVFPLSLPGRVRRRAADLRAGGRPTT